MAARAGGKVLVLPDPQNFGLPEQAFDLFVVAEEALAAFVEGDAFLGWRHAASRARQEPRADPAFEFLDGHRD